MLISRRETMQRGFVIPLHLLAAAQQQAGDGDGLRQTLALMRRAAAVEKDAVQRALAYTQIASGDLAIKDGDALHADLELARTARRQIEGRLSGAMVDLEFELLQAQAGMPDNAKQPISACADPVQQAARWCALAWQSRQRADQREAGTFLANALQCAVDQPPAKIREILLRTGRTQAACGDLTGAAQTARRIADPASQADLLRTIAACTHQCGDVAAYILAIERAREAAMKTAGSAQVGQLVSLCRTQFESNDAVGARQTLDAAINCAAHLTQAADRVGAGFDIADGQALLHDVAGCRQSLRLAQALVLDLPIDSAQAIAKARRQFLAVAMTLARGGEIPAVADLCRQIAEARDVAAVRWTLADALSDANHIDAANLLVETIGDPAYRAFACRRLARAYARCGNGQSLSRWIDSLASAEDRAWAALGAAEGIMGQPACLPPSPALAHLDAD